MTIGTAIIAQFESQLKQLFLNGRNRINAEELHTILKTLNVADNYARKSIIEVAVAKKILLEDGLAFKLNFDESRNKDQNYMSNT